MTDPIPSEPATMPRADGLPQRGTAASSNERPPLELARRIAELAEDKKAADIVLLDLGLPDAQGLEAVRRARAVAPGVPLVVLSGIDDERMAIEALHDGAQDYLVKGQIDARSLLRSLRYAIERKSLQSAALALSVTAFGSIVAQVSEVSVDANGNPVVRKVPGALKWANIVLKRGVDESADLSKWRKQVEQEGPDQARVDGFIEMLDYTGTPIKRYKFLQGWPLKYTGVKFDPKSSDVAVEEIHICHEGLEVE